MTLKSFMDVYFGSFTFNIYNNSGDDFFKSATQEEIIRSDLYNQISGIEIGGISADPGLHSIHICLYSKK